MVLADVMEDLQEHHLPFNRDVPVGMMVETPAAAMMSDRFVEEVDFLSIGTNDLIQYTLAVDRSNKEVVGLYTPADPAVLKLIAIAIEAANRKQVPISMCGQMSGSPLYTMFLLGLGLRQFSLTPSAIPEVKNVMSQRDHPRVPGGGGPGDDLGACAGRKELFEGGASQTRARFCGVARSHSSVVTRGLCPVDRQLTKNKRQRTTKLVPRRQRQWRGKSDEWFDCEYAFVFPSKETCG